MFSKESFIRYFGQILSLEEEMEATYHRLSNGVRHPSYRRVFQQLAQEERHHQTLVREIIDIVQS